MPKATTTITIFVSSPSDLKDERENIEDIIDEVNIILKRRSVRLELIKWETDGYPNIGEDAQDVLNNELPNDYDIFLGFMWARFGTPTGRAGSGTEEEFDNALARYKKDKNSVKIMFYFKVGQIQLTSLDPAQYSKVLAFKERLKEESLLTYNFADKDSFGKLLRIHLNNQAHDILEALSAKEDREEVENEESNIEVIEYEKESELGYWDYIEKGEKEFQAVTACTMRMSEAIYTFGDKANALTKKLTDLTNSGKADVNAIKRISDDIGNDLESLANQIGIETPIFKQAYSSGIDSYSNALVLYKDFNIGVSDAEFLQERYIELNALEEALLEAKTSLKQMRDATETLPRLTSKFRKARSLAVKSLDVYDLEMGNAIQLTRELKVTVKDMIEKLK